MKTKLFLLILAVIVGISTASAESGTCGANLTWDLTDGILTISGTGEMNDYDLSYSHAPWYSYNSNIKSVLINDGCTQIGDYAFKKCYMTSVTIPNSVTKIGYGAFWSCSRLISVTIPNSVTRIGRDTFFCCFDLISVTIGNSVTNIGAWAFQGCNSLSVIIPNSVTYIEDNAFKGVNLIIYSGTAKGSPWGASKCVKGYVDNYLAYSDNSKTNLILCSAAASGEISIPNSVIYIGDSAFSNCTGLTSVEIPNSVTSIGSSTFSGCTGLTFVTIPNSVTSIGNGAFSKCSSLTSVEIPNSVTSIGSSTFSGCIGLTSVTIPNSVTSIGNEAFSKCSSLTSVEIPNSVTSIGSSTFSGCTGLTFVTIPNSVTSIGNGAFSKCSSLTSVEIPNSVTSIGSSTFSGCIGLTSVTIPNSVTSIGNEAFSKCIGLTSVEIPNSVTSIESSTFSGCIGLTSVEIPNSVTSIGNGAFSNCTGLTSITIPNSVTSIGNEAFSKCSSLTSVEIPNSVTSIESSTFSGCIGLTSVTIPNSVTSIGNGAFSNCTGLTSITIPNSVTSIGNEAFSKCISLTSVIWNAVRCTDFTSTSTPFYYSESSDSYWNYDIRSKVTSFVFVDEVEYIPAYLCAGMNKAEITIKNCKTEIGAHALDDCNYTVEGVYNIILPDTTLCYGEEFIIDGVQCDIQKTPNIRQTWTRNLQTTEGCDSIISISVLWKRIAPLSSFSFTVNDAFDTPNTGSLSWTVSGNTDYKYDYYTINGMKYGSTTGLKSGEYRLVFYCEECNDSIVKNITISQLGIRINNQYYLLDTIKHTATLTYRGVSYSDYNNEYSGNITIPKTITFDGKEYQVTGINSSTFNDCNNISSITMGSETPISMYSSGLPDNCIIYVPFGSLNEYKSAIGWKNYTIHVINPAHVTATTESTSAKITLGKTDETKHITSCGMEGGEEEFAGNVIEYIGLEPNSEYANIPLFIKTKEGDKDNTTVSFSTTALELTTKASKPVSSTTAILLAETNMSDAEVSCGFEYKRNDAPADMDGTKVFCPVASGQMAGRLKNLKDDVYYKYRAFYQSAAGNMYYGDWQYIFTGDVAVEFDPILYTYEATDVKRTQARLRGYALAGSEDFTEQGFEYWVEGRANEGTNGSAKLPQAHKLASNASADDLYVHHTVTASGISMSVSLTNLDEGTVYHYRSYAKIGDKVLYGSEMSFTTQGEYRYTVTFVDYDGTVINTRQTTYGNSVEAPEAPLHEGLEFVGWDTDFSSVTDDITVKAIYADVVTGIAEQEGQAISIVRKVFDPQTHTIYILMPDGRIYNVLGGKIR